MYTVLVITGHQKHKIWSTVSWIIVIARSNLVSENWNLVGMYTTDFKTRYKPFYGKRAYGPGGASFTQRFNVATRSAYFAAWCEYQCYRALCQVFSETAHPSELLIISIKLLYYTVMNYGSKTDKHLGLPRHISQNKV